MSKHCVLVSGPTVGTDEELIGELQKTTTVLKNCDNSQIESIVKSRTVALILLEITKKGSLAEVELIKNVRSLYPDIEIILINGYRDREVIATAFAYGAKDAFGVPYKSFLIVERVNVILDQLQFKPSESMSP